MDFSGLQFWLFIIVVNVITFYLFYFDKRNAVRGGYRIPEKTLLFFALIGGSPAAILGQKIFRHKTKKSSFKIAFWTILLIQLIYLTTKLMGFDL